MPTGLYIFVYGLFVTVDFVTKPGMISQMRTVTQARKASLDITPTYTPFVISVCPVIL